MLCKVERNERSLAWNWLYGATELGALIVWGWLRSAYSMVSEICAELSPPRREEICPVTGSARLIASLRNVLSSVPVHTSTRGWRTSPAIRSRAAGEMLDGSCEAPDTPSDDALPRNVWTSPISARTLIQARMSVALAPPIVSFPAIVGSISHPSGLMPSFDKAPEPDPPPEDEVSDEKLDSSWWNVEAGS